MTRPRFPQGSSRGHPGSAGGGGSSPCRGGRPGRGSRCRARRPGAGAPRRSAGPPSYVSPPRRRPRRAKTRRVYASTTNSGWPGGVEGDRVRGLRTDARDGEELPAQPRGVLRPHPLDAPAVLRAEEVEERPQPPRLHAERARGAEEGREPRRGQAVERPEGEQRRRRRPSSVRSTFAQAVFWTRIAPTQTSNGESPGHHPAWPNAPSGVGRRGGAAARPGGSPRTMALDDSPRRAGEVAATRGDRFVDTPRSRTG